MNLKSIHPFILSIAILAGCATTSASRDTPPNLQENGILLLPVTDRALFAATGVSFTAIDLKGGEHSLTANEWAEEIPKSDGKGRRFYGTFILPPGEYELTSWGLFRTASMAAERPKEPFKVKLSSGEALYIGNFNAIRPLGTGQFRDNFTKDLEHYRSLFPWLKNVRTKQEQAKSVWWTLPGGTTPK